jgi:hypothetical protein
MELSSEEGYQVDDVTPTFIDFIKSNALRPLKSILFTYRRKRKERQEAQEAQEKMLFLLPLVPLVLLMVTSFSTRIFDR